MCSGQGGACGRRAEVPVGVESCAGAPGTWLSWWAPKISPCLLTVHSSDDGEVLFWACPDVWGSAGRSEGGARAAEKLLKGGAVGSRGRGSHHGTT